MSLYPDLAGQVAVVTGGSRGIGRAVAAELAANGVRVVVNYRHNQAAAEATVAAIVAAGGQALALAADVSQRDAAQALIDATIEQWGQIDILVNNAGTRRDTLLLRMQEAAWDDIVDVNLKSVFNCTQAALRPMLRRKQGGRIINISSLAGVIGSSGQTNYAASKAGIHGFTRSLAKEVGSRGITVNAVAPGLIETDLTADLPAETLATVQRFTPLRRLGDAHEVAHLVTFLASARAAFITGEVIRIDGGLGLGL